MTDHASEDFAAELRRKLFEDDNVLHKNSALMERVVTYCADDGLEWAKIYDVLRELKILRKWEKRIRKAARELQGIPSIGDPAESCKTVHDTWPDAPHVISTEASAPVGWGFGDPRAAVFQIVEKNVDGMTVSKRLAISYDPIVISRRIQQIETGGVMLELAWRTGKRWKTKAYDRDKVYSSREIVNTALHGAPVGSDNAMDMVKYLRAYEAHNLPYLKHGYVNSSMGWQGDTVDPTKHGFLCGERQIGGNGKAIELYVGDGDSRSVGEIAEGGSFEEWREAIAVLDPWPMVRVGVYASLAAPLIAVLEAPNCIVEWCGDTSGGKTVTLQVAQSCWKNGGAKPSTWNTTVNGLEARAQVLCDMPFIIDDTAEVPESKRRDLLTSAVYMLESGHTRTRASKDMSERPSKTWRTIVLSTGEYTLAEHAGTGGASARVLTFWGPPLGPSSNTTGEIVRDMIRKLRRNFGHAGPRIVKWLTDNRERWDDLRDEYAQYVSYVCKQIESPAAMRLAPTIGLLQVTARLAHEVLGLPWTARSMFEDRVIIEAVERAVLTATISSNKPRQAWEHAISYAESRRSQWVTWGEEAKPSNEPPGGWLGWRRYSSAQSDVEDELSGYDMLAWHPQQLKKALAEIGSPFEATLRTWRDLGILRTQPGRTTTVVRCDGTRTNHRVCLVRTSKTIWNEE